jgi:hypothetical protein
MSGSSESYSSFRSGRDSYGEDSVASSHLDASGLPDSRKRSRPKQVLGYAWILRSELITYQLYVITALVALENEVDDEGLISELNFQTQKCVVHNFKFC